MRPRGINRREWYWYNTLLVLEHFLGQKISNKLIRPKLKALFSRVETKEEIQSRGQTLALKEIDGNDLSFLDQDKSVLLKAPLVFRQAANNWPSVLKWEKEFFKKNFASTTVPLVDHIPGIREKTGNTNPYDKINFKQYFEEIESGNSIYLSFSRLLDNNPVLLEDLDLEWLRKFKYGLCNGEQTFFFMGEEGTKTDLHNGFTHTLFIQIKGRKKWTMYHPSERFFLDPPAKRFTHFYSHANPNKEDDPRYPLLKYAQKYEVTLDKGDVLWLPSLYWHYVENLDSNIGVAFKFVNVPQSFKITKVLTSLILMATKPSLLESFIYNRIYKEDYVFHKAEKNKTITAHN